jgi:hypothetical protein
MNEAEMIVAIVFISMAGLVLIKLINLVGRGREHRKKGDSSREADELRDQIFTLEERIRVLERIVTDSNSREDLRHQFRELER